MSSNLLLEQALQDGAEAFQQGDWNAALEYGHRAVRADPTHPGAYGLLGLSLLQLGQVAEAVAALEQAASRNRNNPAMLGNLAQAYAAAARYDDAHQTFRRAQRLAPAHWPYALGAATTMAQQGKPGEAETLLRRLTERHPQEPSLWYNLGNVQLALRKPGEAEQSYRAALRIAPDDPDSQLSLGSALHQQSKFADAESAYRGCIATQPAWIPPRLNLASVLIDDGRFSAAEHECTLLTEQAPALPEAWRFLGAACSHQGKLVQALAAFRHAATLLPDDAASLRGYGGGLAERGHLHAALRVLARADALQPDALAMRQLRSMVALAQGQFTDGWSAYCSRPAYLSLSEKWSDAVLVQDLPDDLTGKRVLVRREQGIGDELFFLRHVPQLKARGAQVTVCASAKIAALIERSHAADSVIADTEPLPGDSNFQILCGDLPHALQSAPVSPMPATHFDPCALPDHAARISVYWPEPAPSLRIPALPESLDRMRSQLSRLGPPPYIGITWRAGTAAREQRGADWGLSKEIPIAALGAVLVQSSGTLIALQRNPLPGEIDALAAACRRPVADLCAVNEELESMLALLELIDDYVGVSNTNMHLRAAAGRPARVLVPNPAEWRWIHWGRTSPWFPAFRIYRQSLDGDWSVALAALAKDLATGA